MTGRTMGPRRALGMQSLPVAFGTTTASYICCATIDVTQLSVAAYLYFGLHEPTYALVLLGLTLPQVPPPPLPPLTLSDACLFVARPCSAPAHPAQRPPE